VNNGEVMERLPGSPPERADLVYSYRPLSELPGIIVTAKELGAKTIWSQSGLNATGGKDPRGCWVADEELMLARNLVEAAGLRFLAEPYIGEVARKLQSGQGEASNAGVKRTDLRARYAVGRRLLQQLEKEPQLV
jgi:hypothetical protein